MPDCGFRAIDDGRTIVDSGSFVRTDRRGRCRRVCHHWRPIESRYLHNTVSTICTAIIIVFSSPKQAFICWPAQRYTHAHMYIHYIYIYVHIYIHTHVYVTLLPSSIRCSQCRAIVLRGAFRSLMARRWQTLVNCSPAGCRPRGTPPPSSRLIAVVGDRGVRLCVRFQIDLYRRPVWCLYFLHIVCRLIHIHIYIYIYIPIVPGNVNQWREADRVWLYAQYMYIYNCTCVITASSYICCVGS